MKKMTCAEAKEIDPVEYLSTLGFAPEKVRNQNYWYLSPLRNERTPSFKVNRGKGLWFDFGTGQGGDIIDFGTLYHKCSVPELLERLTDFKPDQSLHFLRESPDQNETLINAGENEKNSETGIIITDLRPISHQALLSYIENRSIPLDLAGQFCKEIDFEVAGKMQTAIGFPNESGGFELRSRDFKGSTSPKTVRFIDNGSGSISVFEGFFDFLSFQTIGRETETPPTNCLILNSLAFFDSSRELMEKHKPVQLFLDRDQAGLSHTMRALQRNKSLYIDNSEFYKEHKDLNEWLVANCQKFNLKKTIVQKPIHKQIKIKRHGGI